MCEHNNFSSKLVFHILVFFWSLLLQEPVPHSLFVFFEYFASITGPKIKKIKSIIHQSIFDFLVKRRISGETW